MTTTLNASTAGAGGFIATGDNSGSLALQTAGTTAVTIDTSQNVGIGNTSPSFPLDIVKSTNGNSHAKITNSNSGGSAASAWTASNGTLTSQFGITGASYTSYGILTANSAYIYNTNDISFGADNASGVIKFGTGSGINERMRITSNGFLCINKTGTQYSETLSIGTTNNQGIHINDTASSSNINYQYFTKGAGFTNVGAIYYNGTVMAYQSTSDYRLKENVAPITNALNKISLLKPVTYTWKDNQRSGEGFLAHELQEHFPDAVSGTKDEVDENGKPKYQGVDTSVLIATMVKAIQEQQATINALTARIVALESK